MPHTPSMALTGTTRATVWRSFLTTWASDRRSILIFEKDHIRVTMKTTATTGR